MVSTSPTDGPGAIAWRRVLPPVAAVAVTYRQDEVDAAAHERLLGAVRQTATALETRLGHRR